MTRSEFIGIWTSMADLARAIGEGETTVRNWFLRGSIPFRYDDKLIAAAAAAGRTITPIDLYELRRDIARDAEVRGAA